MDGKSMTREELEELARLAEANRLTFKANLDWSRGLLRVWVVLSALWVAVIACGYLFLVIRGEPRSSLQDMPASVIGATALVPPLLALAFGMAGVWVARGFRRDW
jgi:hypothetical protein